MRVFTTIGIAVAIAAGTVASLPGAHASTAPVSHGAPARVDATADAASHAPGEVIVRYHSDTSTADVRSSRAAVDAEGADPLPLARTELLEVDGVADAVETLEDDPDVAYVEPNYTYRASATPNDPLLTSQWSLANTSGGDIDAVEAWDVTTGARSVVVAVADSGVAWDHSDLAANIWTNPDEAGAKSTNGTDDDGNGYVDDVRGWDWVGYDRDPRDEHSHGTHVAGTIGAEANNSVGVAGISWQTSIMPLRTLDARGVGTTSEVVSAITYARREGAQVFNMSFGGPMASQTLFNVMQASPSMLFVVAAGNDSQDNDLVASYPCNFSLANVVCVAASDRSDQLAYFSNYGDGAVDLAAPGVQIVSTVPSFVGGEYAMYSGTSMAAPHVSGVAALLWSFRPNATVAEVKSSLRKGADPVPSLAGKTSVGGRLDAAGALAELAATTTEPSPSPSPSPDISPTPDPDPTEPPVVTHDRSVTLRLLRNLRASGTVLVDDGFTSCGASVKVKLKRNGDVVGRTTTDSYGYFSFSLPSRRGSYIAVAPAYVTADGHTCTSARSPSTSR